MTRLIDSFPPPLIPGSDNCRQALGKIYTFPSLFLIYVPVDYFRNRLIAFFSVGDNAVRAVLYSIDDGEVTAARQKVERAPAERTRFPVFEVMAGVKAAVVMDEISVIHGIDSSLGNFL